MSTKTLQFGDKQIEITEQVCRKYWVGGSAS